MAKRIIKETLKDGSIQYRVETNKFGPFTVKWHTGITLSPSDYGYLAIFDNLAEAKAYCGLDLNPVIKREDITNEI